MENEHASKKWTKEQVLALIGSPATRHDIIKAAEVIQAAHNATLQPAHVSERLYRQATVDDLTADPNEVLTVAVVPIQDDALDRAHSEGVALGLESANKPAHASEPKFNLETLEGRKAAWAWLQQRFGNPLIVTKDGVPFEDQAEGIRQFKAAAHASEDKRSYPTPFCPSCGRPPPAYASESESLMREFVGWLSGDIPELHKVEVPRLAESLERFLAQRRKPIIEFHGDQNLSKED